VIILGIILAIIGFVLGFGLLWIVGIILIVVGLCLLLAGRSGRMVGGRSHWY
jgi:hypothetical protein